MPKMSELSPQELADYIASYERKVKREPGNIDYQRKLSKLKEMQSSQSSSKSMEMAHDDAPKETARASRKLTKARKSKVQKFHDHAEDHSFSEPAGFGSRAVAIFIDGIILGVAQNIIIAILGTVIKSSSGNASVVFGTIALSWLVLIFMNTGYSIYFLRKDGQTIGKKLMKIKVVYTDSNEQLSISTIIIREVVGKWISSFVFMLGFIMVLLGKSSWHDSMAGTKVVKVD